jgi:hypothetical protein
VVPTGEGGPRVHDTNAAKVDLDVAYVARAIHICCKYLFKLFHLLQMYVAMTFYLDVAYVAEAIHICCKRMFQMFYMLQMYVTESALMLQVFHDQAQVQVAPMCTCVSFTYKAHSWMLHC